VSLGSLGDRLRASITAAAHQFESRQAVNSPALSAVVSIAPPEKTGCHFSRLFTGECESSRLLFLGCRERPEGLFRGRGCFFCGLRPAGWWVRGPKRGENTGKSGRETKNAGSSHSRRFGVWCWVLFFRRKTKSSPCQTLFVTTRAQPHSGSRESATLCKSSSPPR
jgi:hypothetical protein